MQITCLPFVFSSFNTSNIIIQVYVLRGYFGGELIKNSRDGMRTKKIYLSMSFQTEIQQIFSNKKSWKTKFLLQNVFRNKFFRFFHYFSRNHFFTYKIPYGTCVNLKKDENVSSRHQPASTTKGKGILFSTSTSFSIVLVPNIGSYSQMKKNEK